MFSQRAFGVLTATAAATVAAVALAGPAAAHVTINPEEAEQGGYARLAVRVPNESDTAGTIKVQVMLPTDAPLAHVSTKPKEGWAVDIRKKKLPKPVSVGDYDIDEAVTSVTWTAKKGVRVGPEEFEEFDISVGPLPSNKETLMFPAIQTYDDGEVAKWNQPMKPGGKEPEHPAPMLTLVKAESGGHHGSGSSSPKEDGSGSASQAAQKEGADSHAESGDVHASDSTARTLGGVGIGVGALGLIVAAVAVSAARRKSAGTGSADSTGSAGTA